MSFNSKHFFFQGEQTHLRFFKIDDDNDDDDNVAESELATESAEQARLASSAALKSFKP